MDQPIAIFAGTCCSAGVPEQVQRAVQCVLYIFEVSFVPIIIIFDPQGIIVTNFIPRRDENHKDPIVDSAFGGTKEVLLYMRTCINNKFWLG